MDYHFFVKDTPKSQKGSVTLEQIVEILKRFLPVFVLSMFLPLLVFLTQQTSPLGFLTRADQVEEFRVWIEPTTVVTNNGEMVELTVHGQFDSTSKLIPTVSLTANSDSSIIMNQSKVSYKTPFKGEVVLGKLSITPTKVGTYTVSILPEDVNITAFEGPVDILTSPATLVVK